VSLGPPGLFDGPRSVRYPGENRALVTCTICAPIVIGLISIVLPSFTFSEFVLLIAAGLVFVSIARGRLIGSSIRVEARQFPELAAVVDDLAGRLGIAAPQVFIRDDPAVPIAAAGVGEPYALMISSQYYELLTMGELEFLIARELGHIAAGHTRLTSLLSASGRENPFVALVFGSWLRRCEMTADRIGVLCCDDLEDAFGAICMTTFHSAGRRVDRLVLAEQRAELAADPALRLGELVSGFPYATTRLDTLRAFADSPAAQVWRPSLRRRASTAAAPAATARAVVRDDFAPLGRRIGAALIDYAFLAATVHLPMSISSNAADSHGHATGFEQFVLGHIPLVHAVGDFATALFAYFVYSAVLVGLVGQTLGMTVFDVRVVTTRFTRPTIFQSLWRYLVALGSAVTFVAPIALMFGFFVRVQPHDLLSQTRVVRARNVT
jgi:Zn-dependent protease with chaperone function/uncharacterized RDD family membrane protein YckC